MKVLCVVPAYNEEEVIGSVLEKIKKYKDNYIDKIIVVDDSSKDGTVKEVKRHGVDVIEHTINRGPGCSLQTGLDIGAKEGFDYMIQIDADGQHDPKYIPEMLDKIKNGSDMVIGSRYLNESFEDYSFVRRLGIKFFTGLVNFISDSEVTDITSGYRVYDLKKIHEMKKIRERHWAIEQTLEAAKKKFEITEVSVEMPKRQMGKSQFKFKTFLKYPFKMLKNIIKVLLFR